MRGSSRSTWITGSRRNSPPPVLLEADEERPARHDAGHVSGVPASPSRKRFSSRAKPSSATDEYSPVVGILAEKNRVFALDSANSVGYVGTVPTLSPRFGADGA